ncbi:amino acid ABC transporter substrate-binding protein [Pelagibius sp. 7325]|uniref:amino acid ABC transporter substrate-binding protein n=1 Tax=Pelagibius sp. 7325 TaxID=3131994 RepID=UPI0030EF7EA2
MARLGFIAAQRRRAPLAAALLALAALAMGPGAAAQTLDPSLDPTLRKIVDTKTLVVGHREQSVPFSFMVSEATGLHHGAPGAVVGYTIDLCLAVAEDLKQSLNLPDLAVEYRAVTAETRFQALQDGDIDILCGSTTETLKRREQVAFSLLTFATGIEFLVHDELDFSAAVDFNGRRVGVVGGTTAEDAVREAIVRLNLVDVEVVLFNGYDAGLAALEDKQIAAFFGDRILLVNLIGRAREPEKLTLLNRLISYEPYALAVRRDSPDFLLAVDRTLAALYRSRDILPIFQRWFGGMGVLSNEPLLRALYNLQALPEGQ